MCQIGLAMHVTLRLCVTKLNISVSNVIQVETVRYQPQQTRYYPYVNDCLSVFKIYTHATREKVDLQVQCIAFAYT